MRVRDEIVCSKVTHLIHSKWCHLVRRSGLGIYRVPTLQSGHRERGRFSAPLHCGTTYDTWSRISLCVLFHCWFISSSIGRVPAQTAAIYDIKVYSCVLLSLNVQRRTPTIDDSTVFSLSSAACRSSMLSKACDPQVSQNLRSQVAMSLSKGTV